METIPRLPSKVPKKALNSQRPGRLLSQKEYNFVRSIQLEYLLTHNHRPFKGILWHSDYDALQHTVVIGQMGETIALYDTTPLGTGSFGKVFFGVNCDTGQCHAIKIQSFKRNNQDALESYQQEALILSELDRLDDKIEIIDRHHEVTAIAQPLCYGQDYFETLYQIKQDQVVQKNVFSFVDKCDLALQALNQVKHLHNRDIIHCDIKLLNMMWDPQNKQARLIDFGTSLKLDGNHHANGPLCGTELYLAPEYIHQFEEDSIHYTKKGDVYALGVCLLQIFSQSIHHPNPRKQTVFYAAHMQSHGISPYFEEFAPDLLAKKHRRSSLRKMAHLIRDMLEIDPNKRIDLDKAIKRLQALKGQKHHQHHRVPGCQILKSKPLLYHYHYQAETQRKKSFSQQKTKKPLPKPRLA